MAGQKADMVSVEAEWRKGRRQPQSKPSLGTSFKRASSHIIPLPSAQLGLVEADTAKRLRGIENQSAYSNTHTLSHTHTHLKMHTVTTRLDQIQGYNKHRTFTVAK